jgi:hypothetical protein
MSDFDFNMLQSWEEKIKEMSEMKEYQQLPVGPLSLLR